MSQSRENLILTSKGLDPPCYTDSQQRCLSSTGFRAWSLLCQYGEGRPRHTRKTRSKHFCPPWQDHLSFSIAYGLQREQIPSHQHPSALPSPVLAVHVLPIPSSSKSRVLPACLPAHWWVHRWETATHQAAAGGSRKLMDSTLVVSLGFSQPWKKKNPFFIKRVCRWNWYCRNTCSCALPSCSVMALALGTGGRGCGGAVFHLLY